MPEEGSAAPDGTWGWRLASGWPRGICTHLGRLDGGSLDLNLGGAFNVNAQGLVGPRDSCVGSKWAPSCWQGGRHGVCTISTCCMRPLAHRRAGAPVAGRLTMRRLARERLKGRSGKEMGRKLGRAHRRWRRCCVAGRRPLVGCAGGVRLSRNGKGTARLNRTQKSESRRLMRIEMDAQWQDSNRHMPGGQMPLCSHTITVPVWAALSRNQNCWCVGTSSRAFARTGSWHGMMRSRTLTSRSCCRTCRSLAIWGQNLFWNDGMMLGEGDRLGRNAELGGGGWEVGVSVSTFRACVSLGISSPILSDPPEQGELRRRPCLLRERQFTCWT